MTVSGVAGETKVRRVYVSPHADDVALSCGGQILTHADHDRGSLVLTVFTSEGRPAAGALSSARVKFLDAVGADRDTEDKAAWDSVGVPMRALGLPEALLRGTFPFSITRSPRDCEVRAELHRLIASYMRIYPEAQFHFPAGIGRHVDHLLCRDVAFDMLKKNASARIAFYEDVPYSWLRFLKRAHYGELGLNAAASDASNRSFKDGIGLLHYLLSKDVPFPRGRKLFLAVYAGLLAGVGQKCDVTMTTLSPSFNVTTLDPEILSRKRELIYKYKSQIPMLFGKTPDDLLRRYRSCFGTETTIELVKQPNQPPN